MPFAVFLVLVFIGFGLHYEYGHNTYQYDVHNTIDNYNPATQGFANTGYNAPTNFLEKTGRLSTLSTQTGNPLNFSSQDTKGHHELVETVLTRVCRTVNILAHQNSCTNPDDAILTWNFLLTLPGGSVGSLNDVYGASITPVFSCGARSDGSYGRSLITAAIPQQYVQNKSYNYDLTGVSNVAGRTDPCGYVELLAN